MPCGIGASHAPSSRGLSRRLAGFATGVAHIDTGAVRVVLQLERWQIVGMQEGEATGGAPHRVDLQYVEGTAPAIRTHGVRASPGVREVLLTALRKVI